MHFSSEEHINFVTCILRYLKSFPEKWILFKKGGNLKTKSYTDTDWARSIDNRRSISRYFTFIGGNLVTWRSKKQEVVARLSAKAEYRRITKAIYELLWIKNMIQELHIKHTSPIKLYCDSKTTCNIAHNPILHNITKHVEVDRHFRKRWKQ
jgi:hypothetical protein